VGTREDLLARVLGTAASIKTYEDQLRRTASDFRTRLAECIWDWSWDLRTFIV